ncbi:isoprenylcysteine carboxylmethyltransferase family protein [Metabacillus idriensis]|uniref:methyltransferase family protein n=1 Tax=Metabacillus idriensis TaxID=324768 RepID=UPI0008A96B38|nr:isoprenylcysteine carboxylmethyltransferase family protein [Metabacillus idriensis]MCM3598117.1 isoprenylcysteine carboxylmethyltransferase family protein [Metabacillus idriensis]OHR63707.1 hypothetical protein HMPREF3291_03255 [Bacillus sp. HMSC76G11]
MNKVSVYDILRAVLLGPFMVTVFIPLTILYLSKDIRFGWMAGISTVLGLLFLIVGLYLLITTITLFALIGKGTLSPLDPPKKLVVSGPYRYVRNPMFSGVLFILFGEAIFFSSIYVLAWFTLFWIIIHIATQRIEEPKLIKKFGEDYLVYRENVPRWIPRSSPWTRETKE